MRPTQEQQRTYKRMLHHSRPAEHIDIGAFANLRGHAPGRTHTHTRARHLELVDGLRSARPRHRRGNRTRAPHRVIRLSQTDDSFAFPPLLNRPPLLILIPCRRRGRIHLLLLPNPNLLGDATFSPELFWRGHRGAVALAQITYTKHRTTR